MNSFISSVFLVSSIVQVFHFHYIATETKQLVNSEAQQTEEDVIDSVLGGVTLAQAFKRKNFSLIKNVAQRKIQQQVQQIGSQLLTAQTQLSGQNVGVLNQCESDFTL